MRTSVTTTAACALLVTLAAVPPAEAQTMEFSEDEAEDTMTFGEEAVEEDGEDEEEEGEQKKGGQEEEKSEEKKVREETAEDGAADEASAGADGDDKSPAGQIVEEGEKLVEKNEYGEATLLFYKVVRQENIDAGEWLPEARFRLARSLVRMEMYNAALSQLGTIVDAGASHPYYEPAVRVLMAIAEEMPGSQTLMEKLVTYAPRFPEIVPEEFRDHYAYLVGRHFHRNLNVERATRLLGTVEEGSEHYLESRYILAVTHVANYEAEPALRIFKSVLERLIERRRSDGLDGEERKLFELVNLAMGRLFYSTGDYETSLKYYAEVARESPRWPQALLESSWARFQLDEYNRALGNLHTLNSPFFSDSYNPEGPILSSVIYFYNCKYDRVRHELEKFEREYQPIKDGLKDVLDERSSAPEMHEWYLSYKKGDVDLRGRVRATIASALSDRDVRSTVDVVDEIDAERTAIGNMPSSWRESPLADELRQELSLVRSFAVDRAGSLIRQRLERAHQKLKDLFNQKKKILFEVARAERGNIKNEIKAGMEIEQQESDESSRRRAVAVDDTQMYWKFRGEYWRDELGEYVFDVSSQCQR